MEIQHQVFNHLIVRVIEQFLDDERTDDHIYGRIWLGSLITGKDREAFLVIGFMVAKNGINNYISLKTVKPNIDQTAVAKEDCLRLTLADPNCNAYFGLPYNPYGENKSDYAHNPPIEYINPIPAVGHLSIWNYNPEG